jgi:uncharacterized membrane protein (DUF485 family)
MVRMVRLFVVGVALFLIAWVIKEVFSAGQANTAEDLVQKIRMNEEV